MSSRINNWPAMLQEPVRRPGLALCMLYLRTVSQLKAGQLFYYIIRRVLKPSDRIRLLQTTVSARSLRMEQPVGAVGPATSPGEFSFLNRSCPLDEMEVNWNPALPKLWRYNLHYFDYLLDDSRPLDQRIFLIRDWIRGNPQGTPDAWEPYTVSLRIVNWIKFYVSKLAVADRFPEMTESIYRQADWLERNLERHILANHYLKNGLALFFAGHFFDDANARRWLEKGTAIIREQAAEQFLDDGGHYERSPMYHAIATLDLLDVLNLASRNLSVDPQFIAGIRNKTADALDYLHGIRMPDGNIPLFNDAAFGIAPEPGAIFEYAARVTKYRRPVVLPGLEAVRWPDSGYYVARNGGDCLIVDCGALGPSYQPGHGHCDALSYELALDGKRLIVDAGVHDYENGWRRDYCRGTRAHNTVMVDGLEQSEIWGVFRAARRIKPQRADISIHGEVCVFEGSYRGFPQVRGGILHRRSIEFTNSGCITVQDSIEGTGIHMVQSFIHIHPDFTVAAEGTGFTVIDNSGTPIARIEPDAGCVSDLIQGWYFPEFGKALQNSCIVFGARGKLPMHIGYRVRKQRIASQ